MIKNYINLLMLCCTLLFSFSAIAQNGDCTSATPIGEGTFTDAGVLVNGAGIGGASNVCFNTGTAAVDAVWYAYTASATNTATVSSSIDLDTPDTRVSIYTGGCDGLTCLASDDDSGEGFTSVAAFDVVAGETYLVEWDDRWGDGEFDFEIFIGSEILDCPDIPANIGDACDDGNAGTFGDAVSADCVCVGTPFDCPDVPGNIGDVCDDGNADTGDDVLGGDCVCAGVPIMTGPNATCDGALAIGEGIVLAANIGGGAGVSNACFAADGTNAVWYAYTASSDGQATVSSSIDLDTPDTRLSIYTGPCDDLTCLASDDDGGEGFTSIAVFAATSGTTYLVEWDDRWDDGEFDFEISLLSDVVLGCTDAAACNFDALANSDDGSCLIIGNGCDDGDAGTENDTVGADCVCAGTPFDCPDIPGNFGDPCDDGNADTINDEIGADCVCLGEPFVLAPNANCADAIAIGEGIVLAADISGGAGASNVCFETDGTNVLWYAYTASANGQATVSSSIDLDMPDTRVSVYTGPCDDLTCLASDDDDGEGFTSIAVFEATGGTTYLVEWDDRWDDGEFDFEITLLTDVVPGCTDAAACNFDALANSDDGSCLIIGAGCDDGDAGTDNDVIGDDCVCAGTPFDCPDVPGNIGDPCDDGNADTVDDVLGVDCICLGEPFVLAPNANCADAIAVGEETVIAANISGGAGVSNACFAGGTNAIWYAYTASCDGEATVSSSIDLDTPDTRVSVFTGPCDDLTCLAFDDDGGEGFTSLATFTATAGTTYLVQWDDRWDDGEFDFEISIDCGGDVEGCTDEGACNYDPEATLDDGSCVFATGCDECDGDGGVIDNPEIGDACDDGNDETTNDVYIDCDTCMGTIPGDCVNIDPSMWGVGPWFAVSQGTFVAESANDAVLAKGDGDLSVEIFTGECGGTSIGVFNTVSEEGAIERIVVGDLVAGETYYYAVSGGSNIMSKVKTYANGRLRDNECPGSLALAEKVHALREYQMYSNPAVQVTGFTFRFEDVGTGDVYVAVRNTVDGHSPQLSAIPGLQSGHSYSVQVAHRVLQIANGIVAHLYSDYGDACIVNVTDDGDFANDEDVVDANMSINIPFEVVIYPNPNNGDQVSLELVDFYEVDSEMIVTVVDMYGKQIHMEQFASSANDSKRVITFNQNLSAGMYFVNLTINDRVITQKLIVQ